MIWLGYIEWERMLMSSLPRGIYINILLEPLNELNDILFTQQKGKTLEENTEKIYSTTVA